MNTKKYLLIFKTRLVDNDNPEDFREISNEKEVECAPEELTYKIREMKDFIKGIAAPIADREDVSATVSLAQVVNLE